MDDLEKTLNNMKHCASPSLAKLYKENTCMRIKMQDNRNHTECCKCKELCCAVKISDTAKSKDLPSTQ